MITGRKLAEYFGNQKSHIKIRQFTYFFQPADVHRLIFTVEVIRFSSMK